MSQVTDSEISRVEWITKVTLIERENEIIDFREWLMANARKITSQWKPCATILIVRWVEKADNPLPDRFKGLFV